MSNIAHSPEDSQLLRSKNENQFFCLQNGQGEPTAKINTLELQKALQTLHSHETDLHRFKDSICSLLFFITATDGADGYKTELADLMLLHRFLITITTAPACEFAPFSNPLNSTGK